MTSPSATVQIRHITAFVATAETGSLRAAAARLGVTQPGLTKTIRELETLLGVPLVQRTVRGSIPTAQGEVFLVRARAVLEEMRRAREELGQMSGATAGSVTVGMSVGASLLYASEALGRFMREHPQVELLVKHGLFEQLVNGVRHGKLDLSVGGIADTETGAHVEIEPLFRDRIVVAARHGHPALGAARFAQLGDWPWAITNDQPGYVTRLTDHLRALGLQPPRVSLRSESFFAILQLLPQTDHIVTLPETLLRNPLVSAHLACIEIRDPLPETTYALVRKAGVPLTPLAARLAQTIRSATRRIRAGATRPEETTGTAESGSPPRALGRPA